MYLWNIKKLQKDLVKGLKEKEQFKYFTVLSVLGAIMMLVPLEGGMIDMIDGFMNFVLIILMLFWTYRINGGENGKNYIIKNLAISFVTMIRSIFIVLPIVFILGVIGIIITIIIGGDKTISSFEDINSIEYLIFISLFILAFYIGYTFLFIKYFKELRKKELKELSKK